MVRVEVAPEVLDGFDRILEYQAQHKVADAAYVDDIDTVFVLAVRSQREACGRV